MGTPSRLALLSLASLVGCGAFAEDPVCPATGSALLSGVPELQPEWAAGCTDADSWTASVDPVAASWTLELRRSQTGVGSVFAATILDGVAVLSDGELIIVDGEGTELANRPLNAAGSTSSFVITPDGRMVVAGQSGGVPFYRVLDSAGNEIWLRLLDYDNPSFSQPSLALDSNGELWLGMLVITDLEQFTQAWLMQRWAVTGTKQSEVYLDAPQGWGQDFVIDGAGRFAVLDEFIEIFGSDGAHLATVEVDSYYVEQIVPAQDGFYVNGWSDDSQEVAQIDAQGQVVWQWTAPSDSGYSSIAGIAALPTGGVVVTGDEGTIEVLWPDSPMVGSSQPFVLALDADGQPSWGERIAVSGRAHTVAVSGGAVYIGGVAQGGPPNEFGSSDEISWLRRYEP